MPLHRAHVEQKSAGVILGFVLESRQLSYAQEYL